MKRITILASFFIAMVGSGVAQTMEGAFVAPTLSLYDALPAAPSDGAVCVPALSLYAPPIAALPADDTSQAPAENAPPKRRLMPENLSLMESAVWGDNGILRSTGIASPLTPQVRKSELGIRRTMLSIHQIGGFVTLGLMLGTVYFGQRTLDGVVGDRKYHQEFVTATIISYSLTGLLAILSPPPMIRRDEFSTTSLHKTLAWIHVAGMILTPILGSEINRRMGYGASAHFHQWSAYLTTATFAAAMAVMTF